MLISRDVLHDLEGVVPGVIPQAPTLFARSLGCSLSFLWHGRFWSYTAISFPPGLWPLHSQDAGFVAQKGKYAGITTVVHMAELFATNPRRWRTYGGPAAGSHLQP